MEKMGGGGGSNFTYIIVAIYFTYSCIEIMCIKRIITAVFGSSKHFHNVRA